MLRAVYPLHQRQRTVTKPLDQRRPDTAAAEQVFGTHQYVEEWCFEEKKDIKKRNPSEKQIKTRVVAEILKQKKTERTKF